MLFFCRRRRLYSYKYGRKALSETKDLAALMRISVDLLESHMESTTKINVGFYQALSNVLINSSKTGIIYLVVFGYSKVIMDAFIAAHDVINKSNVVVFAMKEETSEMLDTRMFRFELNDYKPSNIRKSFTAKDRFFARFLTPNDKVVFIGGAEAYEKNTYRLVHTNSYQDRLEELIQYSKQKLKQVEIWILAEKYKIFSDFLPVVEPTFRQEMFCDHYDKVDLYNFNDLEMEPLLISDE